MKTIPHLLNGIRILDLSRALAGPTCTRMFAEMGADVIKVEAAPDGDRTRLVSRMRNERGLYFVQQNLNKRSVAIDFRQPGGLDLVRELVPHCDVVVENYKPGVMQGMGLAYEELKKRREDIILCSISALGQSGPLSTKPGYDYIAQAYAGVTSMIGDRDESPYIPLLGLGDVLTGVHAAFAIAAALIHRGRTGQGQMLDIALLDCYYHAHEVNVHQYTASLGEIKPTRVGRHLSYLCPGGVFKARGGDIVIMGFLHHWTDLCAAMGREDLATAPGWASDAERMEHQAEVIAFIESWLQTFPDVDSAVAAMDAHDVPNAPVLSIEQTVKHPHFIERGTIRTINDPVAGEFQIPGHPIRSSLFANNHDFVAPLLGEHNEDVLTTLLGKSADEVRRLEADGVLISKPY